MPLPSPFFICKLTPQGGSVDHFGESPQRCTDGWRHNHPIPKAPISPFQASNYANSQHQIPLIGITQQHPYFCPSVPKRSLRIAQTQKAAPPTPILLSRLLSHWEPVFCKVGLLRFLDDTTHEPLISAEQKQVESRQCRKVPSDVSLPVGKVTSKLGNRSPWLHKCFVVITIANCRGWRWGVTPQHPKAQSRAGAALPHPWGLQAPQPGPGRGQEPLLVAPHPWTCLDNAC